MITRNSSHFEELRTSDEEGEAAPRSSEKLIKEEVIDSMEGTAHSSERRDQVEGIPNEGAEMSCPKRVGRKPKRLINEI